MCELLFCVCVCFVSMINLNRLLQVFLCVFLPILLLLPTLKFKIKGHNDRHCVCPENGSNPLGTFAKSAEKSSASPAQKSMRVSCFSCGANKKIDRHTAIYYFYKAPMTKFACNAVRLSPCWLSFSARPLCFYLCFCRLPALLPPPLSLCRPSLSLVHLMLMQVL